MSKSVEQVREMIEKQHADLFEIVRRAEADPDTTVANERLRRWKERTVRLLSEDVSVAEAERLEGKRKMSFAVGEPFRNLVDEVQMYSGFLEALDEQIAKYPEEVLDVPVPASQAMVEIEVPAPDDTATVFIIHGHDELNLLRLKELLKDRWGLNPVVMSDRPGSGRALIEKFEQEAQAAVFAIALMTPDDVIAAEPGGYGQARPNVVFELGWFYGRLGRSRVCVLLREGTSIHSDLDGVSRIQFGESVHEVATQLEDELLAAGVLTT